CVDEWRALGEVYGWREPASPARALRQLRGVMGHVRRELVLAGVPASRRPAALAAVVGHHLLCLVGAQLGSHAGRLPAGARSRLSLEGRAGFAPLHLV